MNAVPQVDAVTRSIPPAGWDALIGELDRWAEIGRVAVFWWRDDDAIRPTSQLDRLLSLSGNVPVGVAVIPAKVEPRLAEKLSGRAGVAVLQHGWHHANHAQSGKKSEYPSTRNPQTVLVELVQGRERLTALFGAQAAPVFVPPWNRFAPEFVPLLPHAGLNALSATASDHGPDLPPGIAALHVHIDPVAWRDGGGFAGTDAVLDRVLAELRARRLAESPASDAIGILTHHLVMDDATAAFIERLNHTIHQHPAARWSSPWSTLL